MTHDSPPPPPARPIGSRWLAFFGGAVLGGTVAGWCGRWHWLLDLASHFRPYWLAVAVAGLVACLRWRSPVAAACLALAAAANVRELLPYWSAFATQPAAEAAGTPDGGSLRVIAMNVHRVNDDTTAAVAYLRDRRPDIVAVLEVDAEWAPALDALDDLFPHRVIRPRPDSFGIAVLSRWPLIDPRVVDFGTVEYPSIVADVRHKGGDFRFVATHPFPPFDGRRAAELTAHLAGVAEAVAAAPLPCIVAGDLNATPWSLPFRTLVERSGLRDTALGRGVQASWNARLWAPRIPIDHILAPPDAVVLRRSVGPDIGSDHFPVEAELRLRR
jgi:endonuclease/exonuclease/phosphatase (EEP) superfamily protein YafD